jgi:hypothetical protein
MNLAHNIRQLQTDENEDYAIQDESKRVPDCCRLKSSSWSHVGNAHAAHVHTARNYSDHAGNAYPGTKEICCIRNEDTDDDLNPAVIDPLLEPCHDRSHGQAYESPPPIKKTRRLNVSTTDGVLPVISIRRPSCNATRPVPSFTRLSASRISTIHCGRPTRRAIEVAAIASVAATTAPRRTGTANRSPAVIFRPIALNQGS